MNVEAVIDESIHISLSFSITIGSPERVAISCEAQGFEISLKRLCCY